MSYDPTQQVPPPQGYPPQGGYPQQGYPQQQGYTQQGYPSPQPPAPQTYQQYSGGPAPTGAGFDFNAFWKNLGTTGQVASISGLVLFISFLIPWFSLAGTCSGSLCGGVTDKSYTYNAFSIISTVQPANASETYSFPLILVVILASFVLIALPIVGAMGKMVARQVQLFMLITAGVALLLEVIYMFTAFGAFPKETGSQTFQDTTVKFGAGPAFGFVIGLLATLAAGGVYVYFNYLKKPAVGSYAQPYQQPYQPPGQYPGSQPYQPPTQYPGSQPYQPPTQYPGQYPGQQPPQYPGQ